MIRSTDTQRRERDNRSIRELREVLREVVAKPGSFQSSAKLLRALGSQGALAKYEDADRGIVGMSLNTQKLVAEKDFGYDTLDRLRRAAFTAIHNEINKAAASNKSTKVGLIRRVVELEQEVQLLEGDLAQITFALARMIAVGRTMSEAIGTPEATARWRKELRSIEGGLSLRKKPMPANNVVPLNANRPPA